MAVKPKKVTENKMRNWLGSDQLNVDTLVKMLVEIANGKYTPEQLKSDVQNYE